MRHRRLLFIAVILILCWPVPVFPTGGPLSVIINRVAFQCPEQPVMIIFADVLDASGEAVVGLKEHDFKLGFGGVYNDAPYRVMPFASSDKKLSTVILVDKSQDMAASLTLIKKGISSFFERMGFRYKGALEVYSDEPRLLIGPTLNRANLTQALDKITPGAGNNRLIDGLLLGTTVLEKEATFNSETPPRLVMILLTEGMDQGSLFSMDAARAKVLECGITLYVLAYGEGQGEIISGLREIAEQSGGAFFTTGVEEFEKNLLLISDRLRYQYILSHPLDCEKLPSSATSSISLSVKSNKGGGEGRVEITIPNFSSNNIGFWDRYAFPVFFLIGAILLGGAALAASRSSN